MKVIDKIESLENFWQLFDNLCHSLNIRDQKIIVYNLIDAKSWVNENRDEWFEFSYSLEHIRDNDSGSFNKTELEDLDKLIAYSEDYLYKD
jgi:hypothetical protein